MKARWIVITVIPVIVFLVLIFTFGLLENGGEYCFSPAQAAATTPMVISITPQVAVNDINTRVSITGTGFTVELSGTQVITQPSVYLGEHELIDVNWISTTNLSATVPWGIPSGVYTLTVIDIDGEAGTLTDAFTVSQGIGIWSTGGPYGGRVNFASLHPENPNKIYAAGQWVGLFASEDAADNWQPILSVSWPTRLAFDALDSDRMYYSGDSGSFYRTDDGGQTWETIPSLFNSQNGCYTVYAAAHPTNAGVVYAVTGSCAGIPVINGEGGVFYSEDYGVSWTTRNSGLSNTDIVDFDFDSNNPLEIVLATKDGHVFRSTNGGQDWTLAATITDELRRIYINPYDGDEVWALPELPYQPPVEPYLFRSTNLTTWEAITLTNDLLPSGGVWSLTFAPGEIWAAGDWGYFSDNGGENWSGVVDSSQEIGGLRSFAIDPLNNDLIYAADSDRGVLKSQDGGSSWEEMNEGLAALTTRDIATAAGQPDTVYAETYETGLLKSVNGGYTWQELDIRKGGPPKGKLIAIDPLDPARIYYPQGCSGNGPCSWHSPDAGDTWYEVALAAPAAYTGWTGELTTIAAHPLVSGTLYAGAGFYQERSDFDSGVEPCGIYRSADYGENWEFVGPTQAISEVLEIVFDAVDPDLIYASTHGMGLWRSEDGGASWIQTPISDTVSPVTVNAIQTHPDISGKLYIRTSNGDTPNPEPELWLSEDRGDTWQPMQYVFLGVDLVMSPLLPDQTIYTLYTGCEAGLCRSTNDGQTWESIEGAPRPEFLASATDGERSVLYLGSFGGLVTSIDAQISSPMETIPGQGSTFGSGIYRLTTRLKNYHAHLPSMLQDYLP